LSAADHIKASFDRIAAVYDRHAALEQEVGRRLLSRTVFNQLEPRRIVDLGCGTGDCSTALKDQFRKAHVTGLDFSAVMLEQCRRKPKLMRPVRFVCADMSRLPLADQSVDMVFSNLANYWSNDPPALYAEIRRVLRKDGMFLFSTLGPGTFSQLREVWGAVGDAVEVPWFADILEVGDALAAAGFAEPAMDAERITLEYSSVESMMQELDSTGAGLLIKGGGAWRARLGELAEAWKPLMSGKKFPLTFEIIYGAAFGPPEGQPRKTADGDVATISVSSLLKSRPLAMINLGK
jgi:malonyl-CoA O-methyltransferase